MEMLIQKGKTSELALFDTIGDLVKICDEYWEINKDNRLVYDTQDLKDFYKDPKIRRSWTFGAGECLASTREKLISGTANLLLNSTYDKKLAYIMGLQEIQELNKIAQVIKRKRIFREDGNELDINRVMCGDPAHWETITRRQNRPVVQLAFNVSANGAFDENMYAEIATYGSIAADLIVKAGYSVEIYCINITTFNNNQVGFKIKVKAADETLDVQRLLSCGLAGLERYFNFTLCANLFDKKRYGSANLINEDMRETIGVEHIIDAGWNGRTFVVKITEILNALK